MTNPVIVAPHLNRFQLGGTSELEITTSKVAAASTAKVTAQRILRPRSPPRLAKAGSVYIHSIEPGSGKAMVALGIVDLILKQRQKTMADAHPRVGFFRPIISKSSHRDEDTRLILEHFQLDQTYEESFGISNYRAKELLGQHRRDAILDQVIFKYKTLETKNDFVIVEGRHGTAVEFNLTLEMAKNLASPILIVASAKDRTTEETIEAIQISVDAFEAYGANVIGIVLNKADPRDVKPLTNALEKRYNYKGYVSTVIPFEPKLTVPRIYDVVEALNGQIYHGAECLKNPVRNSILGTMQLSSILNWVRSDDCLVVTSGDRADIIVGALQAHQSANFPRLAGIVLTGGERLDPAIELLLDDMLDELPLIYVQMDSYTAANKINQVKPRLRPDDDEKIQLSINAFQRNTTHTGLLLERLLGDNIANAGNRMVCQTLTPKMFEYYLVEQARQSTQRIILPEGSEPRVIQAAAQLVARDIASLTLLGSESSILKNARELGLQFDANVITIVDPNNSPELLDKYAAAYYQLRKHKGTVPDLAAAREQIAESTCFATMMLYCNDADGIVSGARHTTRETIRPALQIIKTTPGCNLVSSVFLMCLDHSVLVYGDCAVNVNPTAEQLCDIAIASSETAASFGIEPRVAMLSYSSGSSGKGCDVDKVREATRMVREQRPDLLVEGPIQYDAAVDPEVAAYKLSNSQVAGKATVFIFPDLNTGNTCYKSIQRETGAVCIGPVLQGLKKPVNDLSRGCTVEDIVCTVTITACQSLSSKIKV